MGARGRVAVRAALAAGLTLAAPALGRAGIVPKLLAGTGGTFAVLGHPDRGGFSASLAAMWPVDLQLTDEERVSFGLTAFADDLGAELGALRDPTDPTADLGRIETAHRSTWGVAWRADVAVGRVGAWTPVASGTWGGYWITDDHRGKTTAATGSAGWSLAAGARRAILASGTLGAMLRYHRLFNDTAGRYMSAGLEWGW